MAEAVQQVNKSGPKRNLRLIGTRKIPKQTNLTRPMTVHFPEDQWLWIAEMAEARGVSHSQFIKDQLTAEKFDFRRIADSVNAILFGMGVVFGALIGVIVASAAG